MNEPTTVYLVQYRATEHDSWKDDTMRYSKPELAASRITQCQGSKIFRGMKFQIVKRTDEVVS